MPVISRGSSPFREDFWNLKKFGCVGDGVADDTTKVLAAIATGENIYLPRGSIFDLASGITPISGQCIFGSPDGGSYFQYSSATGACITQNGGIFRDFQVRQNPSVASTTSVGFSIGNSQGLQAQNIFAYWFNDGFYWNGNCGSSLASNLYAIACNNSGFRINIPVPYSLGLLHFLVASAGSTGSASAGSTGLLVNQCDTANITKFKTNGGTTPIHFKADTGSIYQLSIDTIVAENHIGTGNYGIILGDSSYSVNRVRLTNIELYGVGTSQKGINIGSQCVKTTIDNANLINVAADTSGLGYKDSGANSIITNIQWG